MSSSRSQSVPATASRESRTYCFQRLILAVNFKRSEKARSSLSERMIKPLCLFITLLNSNWKELPIFANASNCKLTRAARCGPQINVSRESDDEILERGTSRNSGARSTIGTTHLNFVGSSFRPIWQ